MKRIPIGLIAFCVVVCMITGCATTDGGQTREEGTGFGALFGAALGAGIGALTGDKNAAAIGAGIGTVVGAGAGYLAGDAVADKKEEYVENEDRLDNQINVVVKFNGDLKEYNDLTAARIVDLDSEVADLKNNYESKSIEIDELNNKKSEIVSLINTGYKQKSKMSKEVIALNAYLESVENANNLDEEKTTKLRDEVAMLRKYIAALDTNNKQMAQLVKSLSVRK